MKFIIAVCISALFSIPIYAQEASNWYVISPDMPHIKKLVNTFKNGKIPKKIEDLKPGKSWNCFDPGAGDGALTYEFNNSVYTFSELNSIGVKNEVGEIIVPEGFIYTSNGLVGTVRDFSGQAGAEVIRITPNGELIIERLIHKARKDAGVYPLAKSLPGYSVWSYAICSVNE